ncbi:hypothetical protein EG68_03197 [Paragonimus skrjabini miyazakii]|uniref:Integrase zinc-binding domain-containing protein n=1 Tax=Paragonimus skrjabini miyazakii TaxID=59628 RepID=A0A8S9Z2C9_9TREM|nr:hypothetical protein EG68_03197 [Paragonimus skrjabini miyazakii]
MVLADTLLRAPLAMEEDNRTGYEQVHLTLAESDSRLPRIRQTFADDEEMEKLEEQIRNGWPDNARQVSELIRPYFRVWNELITENGLVFRGESLVIPRATRKVTMQEIHRSHSDVRSCTRRAKDTVYWPDSRLPRIRQTFADDEEMEKLEEKIRNGWPDNARQVSGTICPYFKVRDELTTKNGLVFRGERLVVPRAARKVTMQEIHRSYLGVRSCTRRAKDTVYWPDMTSHIKDFVSTCTVCKQYGTRQAKEPMVCRSVPKRPWQHVAIEAENQKSHMDKKCEMFGAHRLYRGCLL